MQSIEEMVAVDIKNKTDGSGKGERRDGDHDDDSTRVEEARLAAESG